MNSKSTLLIGGQIRCVAVAFVTVLSAVSVSRAQTGKGWIPLKAGGRSSPLRELSKPARPGCIIVRGKPRSHSLRMLEYTAEEFAASDKLDVEYDDYASIGRFCDGDDPYDVLIQEGDLTARARRCWRRRFPAGRLQPRTHLLGQLRIVVIVHAANHVGSLDLAQVDKILNDQGKSLHWRQLDGTGGWIERQASWHGVTNERVVQGASLKSRVGAKAERFRNANKEVMSRKRC